LSDMFICYLVCSLISKYDFYSCFRLGTQVDEQKTSDSETNSDGDQKQESEFVKL
jgi:hypothetical protein